MVYFPGLRPRALAIVGTLAAASCHYVLPSPAELHEGDRGLDAAARDRSTEGRGDGPAADRQATGDGLVFDVHPPEDLPPGLGWWNSAWQRRRRLTISNPGAQPAPAGLPVVATWDVDAVVTAANHSHVRVVRAEPPSWVELSRHVDDDAHSAEELVWFRLKVPVPAAGSDASYFLYYDSPSAGWPGGGYDVFELLDVFAPGAVDTTRWAVSSGGTVTQSWGLKIGPGARVRGVAPINAGRALDVFVRAEGDAWRVGFQSGADFADGEPYFRWAQAGGASTVEPQALATPTGQTAPWTGPAVAATSERRIYGIERYANRVAFTVDQQQRADHALPAAYASGLHLRFDNAGGADLLLREVHVRQVVSPAPQVRVGPEELQP
jgi:hypothetical protein